MTGNATLHRRALLASAGAAILAGCGEPPPLTASRTPRLDMATLNREMAAAAARARPGVLGAGLMNLESGEHFSLAGERRFPQAGAAALPIAAAVLADVDAGRLRLDETFVLLEEQLSPPLSPVAAAWPARRDYTAGELLIAALTQADNTAADVLMKRIGGPGAVSAWLQGHGLDDVRVDRYGRERVTEMHGLASFRPAWRTEGAFAAALEMVPQPQRMAAMRAYLADPRDTATPRAMLEFLQLLDRGELLSRRSTHLLLQAMGRAGASSRLRTGLPDGTFPGLVAAAARSDLGLTPAVAEAGIFTLKDNRSYALVVLLAGTTLAPDDTARVFADAARLAVGAVG